MKYQQVFDSSQCWVIPPEQYKFSGYIQQIQRKIEILSKAFPEDQVNVQFQFQSYEMFQAFESRLQQQTQIYQSQRHKVSTNQFNFAFSQIFKKTSTTSKKQIEGLKNFQLLFHNPVNLVIFYTHYQKQIALLELKYNYIILPFRKHMFVYIKNKYQEKISEFFVNQLFDMKNKLLIINFNDEQIYKKVSYSKIAGQKLAQKKIKFILISKDNGVTFYSEEYTKGIYIKKQIQKALAYHISIIRFPHYYVDGYILQELLKLIIAEIKPALNEVEKNFEMPVEINMEKTAILINDLHQIFTDGVDLIKKSMQPLKLIEIECPNLNALKKELQKKDYMSFIRLQRKYRKIFILTSNSAKNMNQKCTQRLCTLISSFLGQNYRIALHFVHLLQNNQIFKSQVQRASRLAVFYKLYMPAFHQLYLHSNYHKIVIEPKQYGIYSQNIRKLQAQLFLRDFFLCRDVPNELFKFSVFQPDSMNNQSIQINQSRHNFSIQHTINNSINFYQDQTVQNRSKITDVQLSSVDNIQLFYLDLPMQFPLKENLSYAYKKIKTDRKIEKVLQQLWNCKLKVSKISIHQSIHIKNIKSYDNLSLCKQLFKQLHGNRYEIFQYSELQFMSINQMKAGEKAFLCLINKKQNSLIPYRYIELID